MILHMVMFLRQGIVSTSPNTQAGEPPLVGSVRLLIQYVRSYLRDRRPSLHPQPDKRHAVVTEIQEHKQHILADYL
jgi:hypothetical protein